MNAQKSTNISPNNSFAERIRLLIQRVGSATEIARMCGFSEGVVRSWRDGNTDPSRARCVKLARTLGVSLVWLVAGEGNLQADPTVPSLSDQYYSERTPHHGSRNPARAREHPNSTSVDAERLGTAVRMLQSELNLAGSQASLSDNADLLTQLYEILGPGGTYVDPVAMLAFNHQLNERIRKERGTTA